MILTHWPTDEIFFTNFPDGFSIVSLLVLQTMQMQWDNSDQSARKHRPHAVRPFAIYITNNIDVWPISRHSTVSGTVRESKASEKIDRSPKRVSSNSWSCDASVYAYVRSVLQTYGQHFILILVVSWSNEALARHADNISRCNHSDRADEHLGYTASLISASNAASAYEWICPEKRAYAEQDALPEEALNILSISKLQPRTREDCVGSKGCRALFASYSSADPRNCESARNTSHDLHPLPGLINKIRRSDVYRGFPSRFSNVSTAVCSSTRPILAYSRFILLWDIHCLTELTRAANSWICWLSRNSASAADSSENASSFPCVCRNYKMHYREPSGLTRFRDYIHSRYLTRCLG